MNCRPHPAFDMSASATKPEISVAVSIFTQINQP
jgi:hypothetical protein